MSTIQINNQSIYYEKFGTGGVPVILVHGLLLSLNMWRSFYIPELSGKYTVYALDMRGHGNSRPADNCSIRTMADDVSAFIRELHLEKVIYIGVSMGGGIGIQLAINHPESLSALITISPVTGLGTSGVLLFRLLGSFIAQRRWILRYMLKGLCTRIPPKDPLEKTLDDCMKITPQVLRDFIGDQPPIANIEMIDRLAVPVLVIGGNKDTAVPIRQQVALAEKIPSARKKFFHDSGHMVAYEKQEEVIKEIRIFLDELFSPEKDG